VTRFDQTPINASKILADPTLLDTADNLYVMVTDTSVMGTYKNMIEAINILAERGWETVSISADSGSMYGLVRSPHFKRKNMGVAE
jgi:hypothetical protein